MKKTLHIAISSRGLPDLYFQITQNLLKNFLVGDDEIIRTKYMKILNTFFSKAVKAFRFLESKGVINFAETIYPTLNAKFKYWNN